MRTIGELLQVILDNHEKLNKKSYKCICRWNIMAYLTSLINVEEYTLINKCLIKYLPQNGKGGFRWHPDDTESRINWLKEHIKKIKNNYTFIHIFVQLF